jgi:hypothetical protein
VYRLTLFFAVGMVGLRDVYALMANPAAVKRLGSTGWTLLACILLEAAVVVKFGFLGKYRNKVAPPEVTAIWSAAAVIAAAVCVWWYCWERPRRSAAAAAASVAAEVERVQTRLREASSSSGRGSQQVRRLSLKSDHEGAASRASNAIAAPSLSPARPRGRAAGKLDSTLLDTVPASPRRISVPPQAQSPALKKRGGY